MIEANVLTSQLEPHHFGLRRAIESVGSTDPKPLLIHWATSICLILANIEIHISLHIDLVPQKVQIREGWLSNHLDETPMF